MTEHPAHPASTPEDTEPTQTVEQNVTVNEADDEATEQDDGKDDLTPDDPDAEAEEAD